MSSTEETRAIAVYCGSSIGKRPAYAKAALSVGTTLAKADRRLVYGGGSLGIMGAVSEAVIEAGGHVTGIIPYAMVAAGGEGDKSTDASAKSVRTVDLAPNTPHYETIIVDSMHDRKVEMAKRVCGFLGLPGGFGTFEEVFEVTTWTQLGLHDKPVVLLNVLNFYDPLRTMIRNAIEDGFIQPENERLIVFVDGPKDFDEHETFDWGNAALEAVERWQAGRVKGLYDWSQRINGTREDGHLSSS